LTHHNMAGHKNNKERKDISHAFTVIQI